MVIVLLVAKLTMTALCIGFGLFGGVFSPALFIGVATGSVAAAALHIAGITDVDQVLMISAMAAVAASVVGAPISTVMIVLELTGSYEYAVAAMIAVIISSLVTPPPVWPLIFRPAIARPRNRYDTRTRGDTPRPDAGHTVQDG